jgi:hypothetical protein
MAIIYGVTDPYPHNHKCIYCDWEDGYYEKVKDQAIELVKQHNETSDEDEQLLLVEWDTYIDEAIEIVSQHSDVHTECDDCHDFEN